METIGYEYEKMLFAFLYQISSEVDFKNVPGSSWEKSGSWCISIILGLWVRDPPLLMQGLWSKTVGLVLQRIFL
mgnify:CR=1 FL=1